MVGFLLLCFRLGVANNVDSVIVFREGFVDAKHRPASWWETREGHKLKAGHSIVDLLNEGLGRCPESAIKLVVREFNFCPSLCGSF
jgi:hypothetical protein